MQYISLLVDTSEYDSYIECTIAYFCEYDILEFRLFNESYEDFNDAVNVSVVLDSSGTYVSYGTYIKCYCTDEIYMAGAKNKIKASEYIDEYSVYDYWKYNYFPSYLKSHAEKRLYVNTGIAMRNWDRMLIDAIGVGLKDLGFTNYRG